MAVLPMSCIDICAANSDRKGILEMLQHMGCVEVSCKAGENWTYMDTVSRKGNYERHVQAIDQALEILGRYEPEEKSLLASLNGKPEVEDDYYRRMSEKRHELNKDVRTIIELERRFHELDAQMTKVDQDIAGLTPWLSVSVPMQEKSSRFTRMMYGMMPLSKEGPIAMISHAVPENLAYDYTILYQDKATVYAGFICYKDDEEELYKALQKIGFVKPLLTADRSPQKMKEDLEVEKEQLENEQQHIREVFTKYAKNRRDFQVLSDYYQIRADKYSVLSQIPQTKSVFALSGYVPKADVEKVKEKIQSAYTAWVEIYDAPDSDEVPVKLKNNPIGSMGEGVVTSFGVPGKGEIDPSFFMTICYVILFGIMLSDAGYGFIVSLACGILLLKCPKMEENLRKSVRLFFWCGISTLVWGLLFGGIFGDAIDVVAKTFFGVKLAEGESLVPALWFVPLNKPMKMMVYSMLFGLIHMFLALILKGYMCIKQKDFGSLFVDVICWICLITGLVLIFIPSEMFSSMAQMNVTFSPAFTAFSKGLALFGAAGILLFSGRRKKNVALRLALGAYDLYGVTSWLSDLLSYSRLLALGLATGVIAQVINLMGCMSGNSVLGIIVFVLVFIFGHIINLLINLLGAYVHTCRLQYVEFFGKFYEGSGKPFTPFMQNTKYVSVKEKQ